ncbi:MAG: hypothetical protein JXJ20_06535 [Anaerolineae bacterium]|nr:hypothetical protein [Anaerolineae bacterium]
MTESFDKLKAMLADKDTLTQDEIKQVVEEHGEMTPEENMWLEAELHERKRASQSTVTMEQFLEANKVLESAAPDSDEYKAAQKTVDAFLQGN